MLFDIIVGKKSGAVNNFGGNVYTLQTLNALTEISNKFNTY